MSVEWPEIIIAGTAAIALVGSGFAWVYGRIEGVKKDLEQAEKDNEKAHGDLHDRITDTREKWLPKVDFERTESRLESRLDTGLRELTDQVRKVGESLNQRIDTLLTKLNGSGHER